MALVPVAVTVIWATRDYIKDESAIRIRIKDESAIRIRVECHRNLLVGGEPRVITMLEWQRSLLAPSAAAVQGAKWLLSAGCSGINRASFLRSP